MVADYSVIGALWYLVPFFQTFKIFSISIAYDGHFMCEVINKVIRILPEKHLLPLLNQGISGRESWEVNSYIF